MSYANFEMIYLFKFVNLGFILQPKIPILRERSQQLI
jgi:hypothetical protein